MTYISRRTRIIVSRWTDECDADYILQAVRKRSDGRLKRHSSCDDLRAWVNDYCINHEHLADLMSDGEFSGRPPFRVYGRFIPVPILFKLMQSLQQNDTVDSELESANESLKKTNMVRKSASDKYTFMDGSDLSNVKENLNVERNASLSRVEWKKNHLEKSLYESTGLLNRALKTLEKIDNIVSLAKEESENERNEEIQLAFKKSQALCECSPFDEIKDSSASDSQYSSQSYLKKIQYSKKCTELLRKISGLREKLKKVQECRQLITRQIHMTRVRDVECESSNQVTELLSFKEQSQLKKLKKKLEKLISEKGRLLSEMCDALNSLNNLKKSSRLSLPRNRSSRMSRNGNVLKFGLRESASCACGCNCSRVSSEFDKFDFDSPSGESYCKECGNNFKQINLCDTFSPSPRNSPPMTPSGTTYSRKSRSSDTVPGDDEGSASHYYRKEPKRNLSQSQRNVEKPWVIHPQDSGLRQMTSRQMYMKDREKQTMPCEVKKEAKRQSRVSFADEYESPCRKKYYQDDLIAFEKSLSSQQQAVIQKALKKIECRRSQLFNALESQKRPTSSPTTRRERNSISLERHSSGGYERRVKSETNMQEIEKTLRNYEQRLRNYDALEYKVEEIREKILEANRMRQEWARHWEEGQREVEAEREKSCKEIKKLSSENKMLKKRIQQLMTKFETQCKKIQSLKTMAQKNWELECEAEELKKELMKYQNTLEHQRSCINKWESVVALQRTEIENLMNHIRRLTTANNSLEDCPSLENKNVQKSRSYSAEITIPKQQINRPNTRATAYRLSSEEEYEPCYYEEYKYLKNVKGNQQMNFDTDCYSSLPSRRMNW